MAEAATIATSTSNAKTSTSTIGTFEQLKSNKSSRILKWFFKKWWMIKLSDKYVEAVKKYARFKIKKLTLAATK